MSAQDSFVLPPESVQRVLATKPGRTERELLRQLAHDTAHLARVPISKFHVGAAALGASGTIYTGVNLEFSGLPLSASVHGEQFVISLMLHRGERGVRALAVNAAPCGHCRQFMTEYRHHRQIEIDILSLNVQQTLAQLLPHSFGPADLGVDACMFESALRKPLGLTIDDGDALAQAALKALNTVSYSPYTNSQSAVALRLADGSVHCGTYIESAAYNPSLPPVQSAMVLLVAAGRAYSDITDAVLVERADAPTSQADMTRAVLRSVGSSVVLVALKAK